MPVWPPPGVGVAELPNAGTYVLTPPVPATDNRASLEAQVAATPANATIVFPAAYPIATPWRYKSGGRKYLAAGHAENGGAGLMFLDGANPAGTTTALAVPEEWDTNSATPAGPTYFYNLAFNGNAANNTGTYSCLLLYGFWSRVVDCLLASPRLHHLLLTPQSKDGTIHSSSSFADNWIYHNRFRLGLGGTDGAGIRLIRPAGQPATNADVRCLSNHFEAMQHGIWLDDGAGWTILDNHLYAQRNGIKVDDGWYALNIVGNYIDSYGVENAAGPFYGIFAKGWGGGSRLPTFHGNRISGPDPIPASATNRYAMYINGGADGAAASVTGNVALGPFNNPSVKAHGFTFDIGSGAFHLAEMGNVAQWFSTGQDKEYISGGGGTFTWKAPRWMTGTTTWDPASIANGGVTTQTLTVPGAAVGDPATASLSTLTAAGSILITARVTAADTVSVTIRNDSGGAVDPGSGTLRAIVTKFNG